MYMRSIFKLRQAFSVLTKYTKDHEWIKYDTQTKIAKIGITDYAQKELGDIVHVDFQKVGLVFKTHQSLGAIESVKVAADIYAPVAGEIVGINEDLKDSPNLINEKAEETWILQAKVQNESELDTLLDKQSYEKIINK
ncbi:unnamed protein product [Paramecium octaurelia]|uniref:Glycine cleavage system H protein n=1 Tax=Paramecium octaurelia TaxID=43137 RepID=A0A8S1WRD8_PAROT|nr:unnamed protein product [Paramecium octaurelia]